MANNLSMNKGDTTLLIPVPYQLTMPTGNIVQILGASGLSLYTSIWFTAKYANSALDTDAGTIQKTLAALNLAITTAGNATTNGLLTATLVDADTSVLPDFPLSLVYDVKGRYSTTEQTLVSGSLLVQAHATKAT